MNKWDAIREFYSINMPKIMAEKRNEWGIDPYAWDEGKGIIFLTPIEQWLWHDIRAVDVVLYPQFPVGRFFVDFANPVAKVAIECDGQAFHLDKEKDAKRDAELRNAGWHVYRISGSDCRKDFDEATMTSSVAHNFIADIARTHGISRA